MRIADAEERMSRARREQAEMLTILGMAIVYRLKERFEAFVDNLSTV